MRLARHWRSTLSHCPRCDSGMENPYYCLWQSLGGKNFGEQVKKARNSIHAITRHYSSWETLNFRLDGKVEWANLWHLLQCSCVGKCDQWLLWLSKLLSVRVSLNEECIIFTFTCASTMHCTKFYPLSIESCRSQEKLWTNECTVHWCRTKSFFIHFRLKIRWTSII